MTVADFRLDDEATGIGALLSSVANQQHAALREKALRNLTAVREAVPSANTTVPHLAEIVSALWLRSIAVGNLAGAEPATLQIDITREAPVDGNAFQVEIAPSPRTASTSTGLEGGWSSERRRTRTPG